LNSTLPPDLASPALPHVPAIPHRLDAAASLAFQTPLQEHSPAADGKAGALLTLVGLMFSVLAGQSNHLWAILGTPGFQKIVLLGSLLGFGLLALATVIESFRTIAPRFPAAPESLAFFADIARLSRDEYIRRVEAMTPDDALEQILRYNHTLAGICVLKFTRLRIAIRLCRPAFACWLIAMTLISFKVVF
jgi:hypothetical protein